MDHGAEITAARRAAHGLAANGRATILRFKPSEIDGPGSPHLILARPGSAMQRGVFDDLAEASVADRTLLRFEPLVMAQELATTVELLSAAIQAIPADLLNQPEAERLLASLDADVIARLLQQVQRSTRSGGRLIVTEAGERSGVTAMFASPRKNEHYEAAGGTIAALQVAGFKPVRLLADRDGFRFTEGLRG